METALRDVRLISLKRFGDDRGWFAEVYNERSFAAAGLPTSFAQDNQSFSRRGVLRGLHYQVGKPQGKLVRVLHGHIWDVAVDLRRDSASFGKYASFELKGTDQTDEMQMLWIPAGFAHGFLVLSETSEVLYKATDFYYPAGERCILWNDPALAIEWPLGGMTPSISAKDALGVRFDAAEMPEGTG